MKIVVIGGGINSIMTAWGETLIYGIKYVIRLIKSFYNKESNGKIDH